MFRPIDWKKECEAIAAELAADVRRRFVNDKEIDLHTSLHIAPGPVWGLLARTPIHDEWNTVLVEYAVIPRREIVFTEEDLRKTALEKMSEICALECWQEYKKSLHFAEILRNYAECAVGRKLTAVFDRTAAANPGKYPVRQTHGHAVRPIRELRARKVRGFPVMPAENVKKKA